MKNTDESESSGSRASVASPSQENPRHYRMKLDVFGKVLQRLQESSYEETALPDFEDQLWQHFNRFPARYAFDVKVERAEDVLTHLRLLKLAEDPATRPVFEVRNVQVSPRNSTDSYPALEDDAQSSSKPHGKGVLSTPPFGSSPNFEAITQGSKFVEDVDSAVNATLATRPMHEITFSTIDKPKLLSQLTSLLTEIGLNIQEAHAFSTADGFSLHVFVVDGWSQEETDGLKDALGNEILKLKMLITETQQTFDQALSTLPVTQHGMIWEAYLVFVSQEGVPVETSLSVYRRYEDYIKLLLKSGRGLEAAEDLINALSRVGEVGILWTSTVEHLICVLSEWAQMELRHMNKAGPSVEFKPRATDDTDMEDSAPVRIGMGGKVRSGRRKMKAVSNKPVTMSSKMYTPDDQEWPQDLPEHFVEISKDWRNTPFIIRPAAYQGLLDLCWAVCISRSVEAAFNLLDDGREPVRLSAQHLVNGVHKHESGYITHFDGVRDFMQRHGLVPEASCPWTGKVDKELGCTHEEESVYKVNDLVYLDKIVEKDLILLLQKQPILAVMEYCPELEDHREGIYDGPRKSTSNKNNKSAKKMRRSGLHVVEVLGYNTDTAGETEGKHYWLVQMASGAGWGVNGVGKVMRQISRKEDKSLFVSALYPKVGLREA